MVEGGIYLSNMLHMHLTSEAVSLVDRVWIECNFYEHEESNKTPLYLHTPSSEV